MQMTQPLPEQLVAVQEALHAGDQRARAIFDTIGVCFGYAIAHYADFYVIKNLLILGRVTSAATNSCRRSARAAAASSGWPSQGRSTASSS